MPTQIITKNSSTGSSVPSASDLVQGELAVNVTDKRLFTENSSGAVVELATNPSTLTIGSVSVTAILDEDNFASNSATSLATQQSIKAYVDSTGSGTMTSWILEDGDGTEVSVSNAKEVKFVEGGGLDINWTDTDNGTDGDPYDLTFTVNAAQTGITSLLATDIKIGEDDQTKIDFETADTINFYAGNTKQLSLTDGALNIMAQGDLRLEDSSGGEYVALQAPSSLSSSYTLTLPADDGTSSQILSTDGSGVLSWASVSTAGLTDGSVTTAKLADDAVTQAKIADDAIGADQLASTSVVTASIADDAVTSAKLAHALDVTTSLGIGGGSTNGVSISQGAIALKNGGTQSKIDFYCESSNAHYTRVQAAAHSAYSGNIVLTLPASDGDAGQFLQTDGSGALSFATAGGAYTAFALKTTNYTASASDQLICNHASTAFTITLPSSPTAMDTVVICNAGAATVTVARNSSNINSTASDHTLVQGTSTQLVYVDGTIGWFEI